MFLFPNLLFNKCAVWLCTVVKGGIYNPRVQGALCIKFMTG